MSSRWRAPGIRPGRGSHGATTLPGELLGPPDVEEHEARLSDPSRELGRRDVVHAASEATVSTSAATDGRSLHVSSHRTSTW